MYSMQDQEQDMAKVLLYRDVVPESSRYNRGTYRVSGTVQMNDDLTANV